MEPRNQRETLRGEPPFSLPVFAPELVEQSAGHRGDALARPGRPSFLPQSAGGPVGTPEEAPMSDRTGDRPRVVAVHGRCRQSACAAATGESERWSRVRSGKQVRRSRSPRLTCHETSPPTGWPSNTPSRSGSCWLRPGSRTEHATSVLVWTSPPMSRGCSWECRTRLIVAPARTCSRCSLLGSSRCPGVHVVAIGGAGLDRPRRRDEDAAIRMNLRGDRRDC